MALLKNLGRFLFGGREKAPQQLPTMSEGQQALLQRILGLISPEQLQLQNNPLYQQGQSYLQNLLSGSPESREAFEAPLREEYMNQIVPGLAERFTTGLGGRNSSAFQQSLAESGKDLTTRLGALRAQLQGGAAQQGLQYAQAPGQQQFGLAQLGLGQSPFAYLSQQRSPGFLANALGGAAGGAAGAFGQQYGQGLAQRFSSNQYANLFGPVR